MSVVRRSRCHTRGGRDTAWRTPTAESRTRGSTASGRMRGRSVQERDGGCPEPVRVVQPQDVSGSGWYDEGGRSESGRRTQPSWAAGRRGRPHLRAGAPVPRCGRARRGRLRGRTLSRRRTRPGCPGSSVRPPPHCGPGRLVPTALGERRDGPEVLDRGRARADRLQSRERRRKPWLVRRDRTVSRRSRSVMVGPTAPTPGVMSASLSMRSGWRLRCRDAGLAPALCARRSMRSRQRVRRRASTSSTSRSQRQAARSGGTADRERVRRRRAR